MNFDRRHAYVTIYEIPGRIVRIPLTMDEQNQRKYRNTPLMSLFDPYAIATAVNFVPRSDD